jgi:hypothetical protein
MVRKLTPATGEDNQVDQMVWQRSRCVAIQIKVQPLPDFLPSFGGEQSKFRGLLRNWIAANDRHVTNCS